MHGKRYSDLGLDRRRTVEPGDGAFPDRLIAAADHALNDAKKAGRNCFANYEPAPTLVPGLDISVMLDTVLRRTA